MPEQRSAVHEVFDGEEVREVLRDTFYRGMAAGEEPAGRRRRRSKKSEQAAEKPSHYEVICISLYKEDLSRLDDKVRQLKDDGHRKMSRSALIRYALDTVDLEALPRAY